MNRLKLPIAVLSTLLISTLPVTAQSSKVGVVDFERAVVESAEGKKSSEKFNAQLQAKQTDIEKKQKELQTMRDELLRPIAERATAILNAMAAEQSYTMVIDVSNPENNVVWFNPKNDITPDLIRRIDAQTPKTEPAKTEAPKTPVPTTARPATPAPTPRPATPTPPPATPKPWRPHA